jgi:hypothetical protein
LARLAQEDDMGAFSIIEDRPTPKEVYNARIYIFAATCVRVR